MTSNNDKYDSIGIPELNIKQLKQELRGADVSTLSNVIELLKIDYIDMTTTLANSLESSNAYDISIASNSIRRRTQSWIDVLGGYSKGKGYVDRSIGEIVRK